jgi:hypothetical protein
MQPKILEQTLVAYSLVIIPLLCYFGYLLNTFIPYSVPVFYVGETIAALTGIFACFLLFRAIVEVRRFCEQLTLNRRVIK